MRRRPVQSHSGIFNAIVNGDTDAVRQFIDLRRVNPNVFNPSGMTALMIAARNGRTEVLELLLQKGADPNIQFKQSRNTALHYAVSNDQFGCVKLLIQYDANVHANNIHLQTPLHRAASQASHGSIAFLLNAGAKVESKDSLHRTPLDLAKTQEIKMRRSIGSRKKYDLVIQTLEKAQEHYEERLTLQKSVKITKQNLDRLQQRRKNQSRRKNPWRLG